MAPKLPTEIWPTSKTSAATTLYNASLYLNQTSFCYFPNHPIVDRDYNDHKASQLLDAKADLLVAEARIASWEVDLGFNGVCGVEDSSIGGVPCIMGEVD